MTVTNLKPELIKTKQHFEILDGLRGVTAVSVVIFHFMEMTCSDYSKIFIGHGFLAVDFFFCLSGFVIAYAYDERIGKMGILEFFKSRIIRLHPLVILGSVLGLIAFLFDPFGGHAELYSTGKTMLIFLASIFLIPYPIISERSFNLFGLNAPAWSLFWEYIANIFYAFVLCRISRHYLLILTILAACSLSFVSYRTGTLAGGWAGENFWDGGARVAYSFLAGLLIYRYNLMIKTRMGFIGLSILLLFAFTMPYVKWNWLAELLVVLLYFPLLIAFGAGAKVKLWLKRICGFFGKISYPLYMVHYASIWIFFNYFNTHKPGPTQLFLIITIGTTLLVGLAYLAMVFYDIPVRRYLTNKRIKSLSRTQHA